MGRSMTLRILLFVVCALCAWDFATPLVPLAEGVQWDDEEEGLRGSERSRHLVSPAHHRTSHQRTTTSGIKQRFLARAIRHPQPGQHPASHYPRARLSAAMADPSSEDH
jgi:hypothetical protein